MVTNYYTIYEELFLKEIQGQNITTKEEKMMDKLEEWLNNDSRLDEKFF